MEIFKPHKVYDFMGMRRFWVSLSIFLTVASAFVALVYPKPHWGTDFKGGTEIELAFKKAVGVADVRKACEDAGFHGPDVVEVSDPVNPNRFLIRVQEISSLDDATKAKVIEALCLTDEHHTPSADKCPESARTSEVKFSPGGDKITVRYESEPDLAALTKVLATVPGLELRHQEKNPQVVSQRDHKVEVALKSKGDILVDKLRGVLGPDVAPEAALRVEWVGPKAGKQLRDAAIKSIGVAMVFIMAYVALRFDLRFAPGGIIALLHDSAVVIGVFVLLKKEITLSTIAAILTLVGYSIADTVIVYDRIRENLGRHKGKSFADIINISVSETISRTVLTSGTVLLSVSCFFIWGTGVIKDFALALVIGVIAGTYSSIYVAPPFTEWVDRRFFGASADKKSAKSKLSAKKPPPKRDQPKPEPAGE